MSNKNEDGLSKDKDMMLDDQLIRDEISLESLVNAGPLYLDPKFKKPGFVYEFISDAPGSIEAKKRLGYEIVQDPMVVGQEKASTTHRFGSAVTVQSKCGQLLVLMSVSQERFDKIQAAKEKLNNERMASLGSIEGVPAEYQVDKHGNKLGGMTITRK